MSYIGLSGYNSAHCPPILSKLSTTSHERPSIPSSNTANNPTGPAPTIKQSVLIVSDICLSLII